jgi:hypothetical protein
MGKLWQILMSSSVIFRVGRHFTQKGQGENSTAHTLAKAGVQHDTNRIWIVCFQESIQEIVLSELPTLVI